ncbi:extracellular protein [Levilactobacillus brevis]|nr:extracellular protein [Levilactobacillus brevis]
MLLPGANTVTLYATYNAGTNVSDVIKATINVGSLAFSNVTSNIAFNAKLTGTSATIAPSSQPNISVVDTRVTGKHWALSANLTGLAASFPGEVVYQPGNGSVITLSSQDAAIDTGSSAAITDVSKQWSSTWTDSSSKGLFLKIPSATTAGTYDGTITWNLKNAPS